MKAKPRFRVISISQAAKNSTDIFNSFDLFLFDLKKVFVDQLAGMWYADSTMKVEVVTSYRVFSTSYIDLPINNVKEILDYFIKDNILHCYLGNEEWKEFELLEKGEEEYEKTSEVKFYSAESHSTVLKVSKSL